MIPIILTTYIPTFCGRTWPRKRPAILSVKRKGMITCIEFQVLKIHFLLGALLFYIRF